MDELSLAISWLHFLTLRKWNKAISEVEAYGASEEIAPKRAVCFAQKCSTVLLRANYPNISGPESPVFFVVLGTGVCKPQLAGPSWAPEIA